MSNIGISIHEDTYSFSNVANSYKMFHSWLYGKSIHLLIKRNSLLHTLLFRSTDSWTKKIRRGRNFQGSCQKPESKGSHKCSIGCTNTLKVSCLMRVDMVSSNWTPFDLWKKKKAQNITPSDAEMSGGVGEGGGVKLTHLQSQIQQTLDTLSIKKTLIKYMNNRLCYMIYIWYDMDDIQGIRSRLDVSIKGGHLEILQVIQLSISYSQIRW